MRVVRFIPILALVLLAGCGSMLRGSYPHGTSSPFLSDATLRLTPGYAITVEKILFSAAGAALLFTIYDPLAPNWVVEEEAVAEDTYRLGLTMKRFYTGGEGEASAVVRRWAEAVQQEGQYDGYQIQRFEQGIESSTPIARRYAHAVVRMLRNPPPALPAVMVGPLDAVQRVDLSAMEVAMTNPDALQDMELAPDRPLPRPPALGGSGSGTMPEPQPMMGERAAGDLPRPPPRGAVQVMLNARILFGFDSSQLTATGRAALDREVLARREELGRLALLLVSGHTDRIGSYEYNQRLSQARAQAVRNYLVERGFDGKKIVSIGYGKTRPLAGISCDETRSRGEQIECLSPQRRVELEFRDKALN